MVLGCIYFSFVLFFFVIHKVVVKRMQRNPPMGMCEEDGDDDDDDDDGDDGNVEGQAVETGVVLRRVEDGTFPVERIFFIWQVSAGKTEIKCSAMKKLMRKIKKKLLSHLLLR